MSTSKGEPGRAIDGRSDGAPPERCRAASDRGDLPLDAVFDVLKNRRRRLVLRYLLEVSATSTLSDLAEHIAAIEEDKPERSITSSERKRVYVCLYQCHLPKMDDVGIIDFESDRGTVTLADDIGQVTQYLDIDTDDGVPDWPKYYVALATIGGGLFVVQRLVFPADVLSGFIMGALLGLFVNFALEHAYKRGIPHVQLIRPRRSAAATANTN